MQLYEVVCLYLHVAPNVPRHWVSLILSDAGGATHIHTPPWVRNRLRCLELWRPCHPLHPPYVPSYFLWCHHCGDSYGFPARMASSMFILCAIFFFTPIHFEFTHCDLLSILLDRAKNCEQKVQQIGPHELQQQRPCEEMQRKPHSIMSTGISGIGSGIFPPKPLQAHTFAIWIFTALACVVGKHVLAQPGSWLSWNTARVGAKAGWSFSTLWNQGPSADCTQYGGRGSGHRTRLWSWSRFWSCFQQVRTAGAHCGPHINSMFYATACGRTSAIW